MANSASPSRLAVAKFVSRSASGQRTAMPTQEMIRLTLKTLEFLECLPTIITAKAEATAESSAKVEPSMLSFVSGRSIKANLFCVLLVEKWTCCFLCMLQVTGNFLFEVKIAYWRYDED